MAVAALLLGCVSAIPLDKTGNVAQDNTTAVVNTTDAIHHNKTQHEAPKVIHHLAQEIAQRLGQNLTRHQAQNLAQTKAFNLTQNGAFNHTQKGAHNVTHVGGLNISQAAGFNVSYYGGKRIMCAPALKVIFAHGNQFQNTMGKTGRLSKRIAEKIPGSYAENVEYPASMENPMYIYSVAQGSFAVQHAVEAYHFACPRSLMAVLGYSQVTF
jgi:hypothetical protein